jgi:hypothetical protein
MGAAKEVPFNLDAMSDDLAAAVFADGSDGVNGALQAVEDMPRAGSSQLKTFVVVVTANFAASHGSPPEGEAITLTDNRALDVLKSFRRCPAN